MADRLSTTQLLTTLILDYLGHLTLGVAFNKTLKAIIAPLSLAETPVQADRIVEKQFPHCLEAF